MIILYLRSATLYVYVGRGLRESRRGRSVDAAAG
jgi:hypothetical protein